MATTKKYVSLEKLGLYDEKIKGVISAGDTAALDNAKAYADSLAKNYDVAGAAATALDNAKTYADNAANAKDAAIQAAKTQADKGVADAATAQAAADAAQAAADKAQGEVDALETLVGTLPDGTTATSVVDYVNVKTAGIATDAALGELQGQVTAAQSAIDAIEADYLKAADKTELEGKITDEADRAKDVEADLESRLATVEGDYLKAADKTELQGNIDTLTGVVETLRDGVDAEKVDGVVDLINYVEEHGTEVTGMKNDISDNATAIAGVADRMDTAEGKITAVEGAVATKAEKTYVDEKVEALQGVDEGFETRIAAVEAKFGEGDSTVESLIADAKQSAIDTAAADATTKANTAESNAKAHATELNTAMDTRVKAVEAKAHEHANKELLDTYTQTEANLADAVAKKHEHANAAVLNGITAENVTTWNTVTEKATATALNEEITRAKAAEQANADAIAAFIEVSEAEVLALFQTQA